MNLPVLAYRRFCTKAYSSSLLLMGKDPQDNSYITSAMRSGYRSLGRVSGHRRQSANCCRSTCREADIQNQGSGHLCVFQPNPPVIPISKPPPIPGAEAARGFGRNQPVGRSCTLSCSGFFPGSSATVIAAFWPFYTFNDLVDN
jgi:hypothetical protein